MHRLYTHELTFAYGQNMIIEDLNLTIPTGEITVLIGSNGCGKSTLLKSLARILKPAGGSVLLEGKDIAELPTKEVAKNWLYFRKGLKPQKD